MVDSKTIDELLDGLNSLLIKNKDEDGEYHLDFVQAAVALDFAKSQIERAISLQQK